MDAYLVSGGIIVGEEQSNVQKFFKDLNEEVNKDGLDELELELKALNSGINGIIKNINKLSTPVEGYGNSNNRTRNAGRVKGVNRSQNNATRVESSGNSTNMTINAEGSGNSNNMMRNATGLKRSQNNAGLAEGSGNSNNMMRKSTKR